MSQSRYLARQGQISGPFSEGDLEKMAASGELMKYSWIWDAKQGQWNPLDPAPSSSPETRKKAPPARESSKQLEAICSDRLNVVSGGLSQVNELGCDLATNSSHDTPVLCVQAPVVINLLDPATGKSVNVRARVTSVQKTGSGWSYRLHWGKSPALI